MAFAFRDRREAGRILAGHLTEYANRSDVIVLALPRGGVPVAFEIAEALRAQLDVFTVRKLGVPGHEELAMGALASGEICVLDEQIIEAVGVSRAMIEATIAREERELERRELEYRGQRPFPDLRGQTVILVDDGMATGSSMRAAVVAVRRHGPRRVIVAVPVAASSTCEWFAREADDCVCAETPNPFHAVGTWYEDFSQTTDDEVRELLNREPDVRQAVASRN